MDLLFFLFCLVFVMSLCASVYMCFAVTCWERTDILALVYMRLHLERNRAQVGFVLLFICIVYIYNYSLLNLA